MRSEGVVDVSGLISEAGGNEVMDGKLLPPAFAVPIKPGDSVEGYIFQRRWDSPYPTPEHLAGMKKIRFYEFRCPVKGIGRVSMHEPDNPECNSDEFVSLMIHDAAIALKSLSLQKTEQVK